MGGRRVAAGETGAVRGVGSEAGGHRAPRHLARRLKQPPQRPLEAPLNLDVNIFQMKTRPDKVKQMQAPAWCYGDLLWFQARMTP